jgi:hypothetical protein
MWVEESVEVIQEAKHCGCDAQQTRELGKQWDEAGLKV